MTIRITEDDAPHGCVEVDYDVEGFEIETARVNGDLSASLVLGAEMLKLLDDLERDGRLESAGGRPVPSKHANLSSRHGGGR